MDKLALFDLRGRKAIVTGGCAGIGKVVSQYFGLYGAEVCIVDISDNGDAVAKELHSENGAVYHAVKADLSESGKRKKHLQRCWTPWAAGWIF